MKSVVGASVVGASVVGASVPAEFIIIQPEKEAFHN